MPSIPRRDEATTKHRKTAPKSKSYNKLTGQQKQFILYLLESKDLNVSEAASRAGYSAPDQAGAKLMRNPIVAAEVQYALSQRALRAEVTADRILQEVDNAALRDPVDLADPETGQIEVSDLRKIPESIRRCIDGLKVKQTINRNGEPVQTIELKLIPKLGALELAMKHRGMLDLVGMQKPKDTTVKFDWNELYGKPDFTDDPVQQRLLLESKDLGNVPVPDSRSSGKT